MVSADSFAGFFAVVFFAVVFLAVVFLAAVFFAVVFLAVVFAAVFLADAFFVAAAFSAAGSSGCRLVRLDPVARRQMAGLQLRDGLRGRQAFPPRGLASVVDRLLGGVRVLRSAHDVQLADHRPAETVLRQHA